MQTQAPGTRPDCSRRATRRAPAFSSVADRCCPQRCCRRCVRAQQPRNRPASTTTRRRRLGVSSWRRPSALSDAALRWCTMRPWHRTGQTASTPRRVSGCLATTRSEQPGSVTTPGRSRSTRCSSGPSTGCCAARRSGTHLRRPRPVRACRQRARERAPAPPRARQSRPSTTAPAIATKPPQSMLTEHAPPAVQTSCRGKPPETGGRRR